MESPTPRPRANPSALTAILDTVRVEGPLTRSELGTRLGLARSTVSQRVDLLVDRGLLRMGEPAASTGGRRAETLVFNPLSGTVLAADIGATHYRVALASLSGEILAEDGGEIQIETGPDAVLEHLDERFRALLAQAGRGPEEVRALGVGLPGPVEFATGRPVSPPIMPGWDGYPVGDRLRERFGVPAVIDNDVNIAARGEHQLVWPHVEHLLFVKVATGIGCGIVASGRLYRGQQGAAGDIGHIRVSGRDDIICECGNTGCLEAVASGRALARHATELGFDARDSRDVVALVAAQELPVIRLVREAGRFLGEVLASVVNALNPSVIVIGGALAEAHQQLFAGLRETIYQRSTPLATQRLEIAPTALGTHAGVHGAIALAIDEAMSPDTLDLQVVGIA
jgi:predicted NBD/HSP70 family sugar kinase